MTGPELLSAVATALTTDTYESLAQADNFANHVWFWQDIHNKHLFPYLGFVNETRLVQTAQNLLYAFKYSGTKEALIRLCLGLFGDQSIVEIIDIGPGEFDIVISNISTDYAYTFALDENYAFALDDDFAFALSEPMNVLKQRPKQFFELFLTPGRVLRKVILEP